MCEAFETVHKADEAMDCHRHRTAFLALVLEGEYEERSVDGKFVLGPGSLILHPPFHAHSNHFLSDQVRVLNVDLPEINVGATYRVATSDRVGEVLSVMQKSPKDVLEVVGDVFRSTQASETPASSWMGIVSDELLCGTGEVKIRRLASAVGVSAAHASRAFARHYGHSPVSFRREVQLRKALASLAQGDELADAAAVAGFADQSHMGRAFRKAFGLTPGQIRSAVAADAREM